MKSSLDYCAVAEADSSSSSLSEYDALLTAKQETDEATGATENVSIRRLSVIPETLDPYEYDVEHGAPASLSESLSGSSLDRKEKRPRRVSKLIIHGSDLEVAQEKEIHKPTSQAMDETQLRKIRMALLIGLLVLLVAIFISVVMAIISYRCSLDSADDAPS
ncbi:hypothetical protein MPSEU_000106100 [Mayamaea pseudoterrestris]|nr:hypothetical protein MPSEU_000106100 [Mayamaea pseudoterrestris]